MVKINENYICFTPDYLKKMYEEFSLRQVFLKSLVQDLDLVELNNNPKEMYEFLDPIIKENQKNTDINEIFQALHLPEYYKGEIGIGICFELKTGVDKNNIKTLEQLISNLEKNTDVDCAIRTDSGMRLFQLKNFHKMEKLDLNTKGLISFIEKSLKKYGNKATKNLLINLQKTDKAEGNEPNFFQVYEYFKNRNLGNNEILVQYNDSNIEMCLVCVYPELRSKRVPINWRESDSIKNHGKWIDNNN